eukprot:gb/GEZN01002476.1/.p1 GENE.gb/GEZN01002476.1/~~gb/GEZN01002476.1/.p1  ORF type:complete len:690 (+),score=90.84 gb/GEZN01002476.1/:27-2072(+)
MAVQYDPENYPLMGVANASADAAVFVSHHAKARTRRSYYKIIAACVTLLLLIKIFSSAPSTSPVAAPDTAPPPPPTPVPPQRATHARPDQHSVRAPPPSHARPSAAFSSLPSSPFFPTATYSVNPNVRSPFVPAPKPKDYELKPFLHNMGDDTLCHGNWAYYDFYPGYPGCAGRLNFTLGMWHNATDAKSHIIQYYKNKGMDGDSYCSVLEYLYKYEPGVCPPPWQQPGLQPRIHGVNLGGWLLLEPWINPTLFNLVNQGDKILPLDEWHWCTELGKEDAHRILHQHWDTWVTEQTIMDLAYAGINHVRIPIGYWILDDIAPGEPWVEGGMKYLKRCIEWCKKHGIWVLLDLHSAPGSQNGYDNSGELEILLPGQRPKWAADTEEREIVLPNGTFKNQTVYPHIDRTLRIIETIMQEFQWEPTVVAFEPLNEPSQRIPAPLLADFFHKAYSVVRQYRSDIAFVIGDSYNWGYVYTDRMFNPAYTNVWLDAHIYHMFSRGDELLSTLAHLQFACKRSHPQLCESPLPSFVGEWSLATDDCTKWLNGFHDGARWEGTFDGYWRLGSCAGRSDMNNKTIWTDEYKEFLYSFAEVQMDAYEPSPSGALGWFFWNFKSDPNFPAPQWDYLMGVQRGYIPSAAEVRNPAERKFGCHKPFPPSAKGQALAPEPKKTTVPPSAKPSAKP